mgnify:CR=1 FL=1
MITLYYIEGIDRENIPYVYPAYKTQTTIQDYLREHSVVSIPNSYYPPYYRNIISISSEDFTGNFLETSINYLSLSFGNKEYYYFIDRIEYVNEDLYKLHVTMDVIMTYINDIKVHSGIIERKFINRWITDKTINRNYIRENCSKGLFQLSKRTYLNDIHQYEGHENDDDECNGIYVVRTTQVVWKPVAEDSSDYLYPSSSYIDNGNTFASKYITYIIPYGKNIDGYNMYDYDGKAYKNDGAYASPALSIFNTNQHENTIDCRFYPINLFNTLFKVSLHKFYVKDALHKLCLGWYYDPSGTGTPGGYQVAVYRSANLDIPSIKYKHEISIIKNASKGVIFDYSRVPALVDENYMRLSYGDGEVQATVQLYYINTDYTYCYYKYDINTGSKFYWFDTNFNIEKLNDRLYGNDNLCNTLAVNENPPVLELVNVNWNTWKAYNSATLPLMLANTALNVGKFALGAYANFTDNPITTLLGDKGFVDQRYKQPTLNKKGFRKLYDIEERRDEEFESMAKDTFKFPSRYENIINNAMSPNTTKSGGNFTSSIMSEGMNIRLDEYRVNDFNQCAQYYHRNGYLVDEYINEVDSIFDYVSTRYYYNILKMRDVDISLVNSPISTEILDLITERLENGIRLWNCDEHNTFVKIGNYTYDNVERSYLNE